MTGTDDLDRQLRSMLDATAPRREPESLFASVMASTRTVRQRPGILVVLQQGSVGTPPRARSRFALAVLLVLLLAALLGALALVGSRVIQPPSARRAAARRRVRGRACHRRWRRRRPATGPRRRRLCRCRVVAGRRAPCGDLHARERRRRAGPPPDPGAGRHARRRGPRCAVLPVGFAGRDRHPGSRVGRRAGPGASRGDRRVAGPGARVLDLE